MSTHGSDIDRGNTAGQQLASEAFSLLSLSETYEFARAECPGYAGYPLDAVRNLADFQSLPVLRREQIECRPFAFCARSTSPDFFTATSATTTGRSLNVPKTFAEFAACTSYLESIRPANAERLDGMSLRLLPAGRLQGGAGESFSRQCIATYETNAVRENQWDVWCYIMGQLFSSFPCDGAMKPITAIHATPPFGLLLLTKYMLERGIPPADTDVRALIVTGGWMGRATRREIEEAWKVRLATAFSCAEMNGSAQECRLHSGRYHFDHRVFPEVLHEDSGSHVGEGEQGRLVLTGPHPFHQAMILLRYDIGDWARWLGRDACECGVIAPTIEHLGRWNNLVWAVLGDGQRLPLPSRPALDALDGRPAIPRVPRPQFLYQTDTPVGGPTKVVLHTECFALGNAVWQQRLRQQITEAWMAEYPEIARAVDSGAVALDVALHPRSNLTIRTSVI